MKIIITTGDGTDNMIKVATKHNIPVKRVPDNEQ